jgi:hypothetical protein
MTYGNNLNNAKTCNYEMIGIFSIERLLLLATVNSCQLFSKNVKSALTSSFENHIGISMILIF